MCVCVCVCVGVCVCVCSYSARLLRNRAIFAINITNYMQGWSSVVISSNISGLAHRYLTKITLITLLTCIYL